MSTPARYDLGARTWGIHSTSIITCSNSKRTKHLGLPKRTIGLYVVRYDPRHSNPCEPQPIAYQDHRWRQVSSRPWEGGGLLEPIGRRGQERRSDKWHRGGQSSKRCQYKKGTCCIDGTTDRTELAVDVSPGDVVGITKKGCDYEHRRSTSKLYFRIRQDELMYYT